MERTAHVPDTSDDVDLSMRFSNVSDAVELNDDMIHALRASDFTCDPDADEEASEGEGAIILEKTQKNVAVLSDNLKRHEPACETGAVHQRWSTLVSGLKPPVSTILAHAVVQRFDSREVSILLSRAFEGLLSREHEACVTHEIRQIFGWGVNLSVSYGDAVDERTSIAAEEARAELDRQQRIRSALEQHPLFKAVMHVFQPEPRSVRFSFNNDRIFS